MPITPKLCITYEADASSITIKDNTGAYVLNFNEAGYGAPNTERLDLAGVLQVYYQPYEGDSQLLTSLSTDIDYNNTFPNTEESSFAVAYNLDGWYTYIYTLVNTTTSPNVPAPVENLIVYNIPTSDLRQYDTSLILQPVFDVSVLSDSNIYELVQVKELLATKLRIKKNELTKDYFECKQCVECGCDEELKVIQHLDHGIRSSLSQFSIAPREAQRMIERLTKQFKT